MWLDGMSIMLAKAPRKINVKKLRDLLLLEADFNALHKITFNKRVLLQLKVDCLMPQDIIGGRTIQSAIELVTRKKLIADKHNQKKTPTLVISVDASNFYDRVARLFS